MNEEIPFEVDPRVSNRMAKVRNRDTKPETALRKALRSLGLGGYRVDFRPVPELRRTADIVFLRARVAVMVDGCFWHRCPEHYRPATQRSIFWSNKISANVARDQETNRVLTAHGWLVVRVWEHDDPMAAAKGLAEILKQRLPSKPLGEERRFPP